MRSVITQIVLFATLSLLCSAVPITKRALTFRAYNDMSISAGTAGNAAAEATTVWAAGLDLTDLTKISAADLAILKVERENAEDAETAAFNLAIAAASGAAATALQCGKIKYGLISQECLFLLRVLRLTGVCLSVVIGIRC